MASTALSSTPWSTARAIRSASVLCPEATIAISRLVTRPACRSASGTLLTSASIT